MIYLDNAATTRIDPVVRDKMLPYLKEEYGNPGTVYGLGLNARKAVDEAREQVAKFFGTTPEHIIFTSGGTESNNTAIKSCVINGKSNKKNRIVTDEIEHDSVLHTVDYAERYMGASSTILKPNETGEMSVKTIVDALEEDCCVLSTMYMNNEIGTTNPVKEIGIAAKRYGIPFHVDCVQAAGCIPINVNKIGCDFASVSSHKIHGPKGVGALYVRNVENLIPLVSGGDDQEFGFRGGTENVAGIVGFGESCRIITDGNENGTPPGEYLTYLKRKFCDTLEDMCSQMCLESDMSYNAYSNIIPGKTLSVRFVGIDAETLIIALSSQGIYVSSGSACRSHESVPSRVLKAIGLSDDEARETIRVSFSTMNTVEEVKTAAVCVAETVHNLKKWD